ncbi:hypothetical protein TKK_0013295 [Trichogramma kaykai]|uniref:Integrase catalytic domain-containing protein n=1 Tax=Trichogramma kaykai TaxID=54128 RepID=A0ABD2WJX9_9HYME
MAENHFEKSVKALQTDNGKEYCNEKMDKFLKSQGIQRRLSAPRTPEQNGLAERKNRVLVEAVRCMLSYSGLPLAFWREALMTANYIRNRCPTMGLNGDIPYAKWFGKLPDLKFFKIFGAKVCVLNKAPKNKLTEKAEDGRFVGYSNESKAYRVWVPE